MRRNCNLQPTSEFIHTSCVGDETTVHAWGGRINTAEVEGHPYAVSKTTLRANADKADWQYGDSISYRGKTFKIYRISYTTSLCRVIIGACCPELVNCPLLSATIQKEVKEYGCDAREDSSELATMQVVRQLALSTEQFANSSVNWTERYKIYMEQSAASFLSSETWIQIGTDYYSVENVVDMDMICRLPYAEVVKGCPSWA